MLERAEGGARHTEEEYRSLHERNELQDKANVQADRRESG